MHRGHLVNHIHRHDLRSDNTLYVIAVVSNPARYHSRYRLAREFIARMQATANVQLCLVEAATGDRHFEVTEAGNRWHLQLRTNCEVWIKENMINLGIRHLLPRDWKYVAWVDCDVEFSNPQWALDTIHQLQHYPIVQPYQNAINMGPHGNILRTYDSVGFKVHKNGVALPRDRKYTGDPYTFGHCGYAWACTRSFYENVKALIDFAILGSADHHMALGCRGYYSHSVHSAVHGNFMTLCHAWQERALQHTNGVIGYTVGHLRHYFHGPMARRQYIDRWSILVRHNFDPVHDLRYDEQGLIQLVGKPLLEHDIRLYNRSRAEDSIEE
jgi:hypothetical protein